MCAALSSRLTDKCYPCPLAGGDYSTKTGMLLRDTYQPLFSILQENLKDLSETGKGSVVFEMCHFSMNFVEANYLLILI